jgi:hypothetical protein
LSPQSDVCFSSKHHFVETRCSLISLNCRFAWYRPSGRTFAEKSVCDLFSTITSLWRTTVIFWKMEVRWLQSGILEYECRKSGMWKKNPTPKTQIVSFHLRYFTEPQFWKYSYFTLFKSNLGHHTIQKVQLYM